jgi:hypothetical protein
MYSSPKRRCRAVTQRTRCDRLQAQGCFLLIARQLAADNLSLRASVDQPSLSLDVVRAAATCAYARFSGVLLVNWRRQVVLEDIKGVVNCRNQMMKQEFLGAIHISEPGLPLPDDECRAWARRAMEAGPQRRTAIALVIYGDGFGASAMRSVGTAVFALRSGPTTRIFGQVAEAAAWFVEEVECGLDPALLARTCQELREVPAR